MSQGKRVVLASRPVGEPKPSDFRIEEYAVPAPGPGEVLLRTVWLSLDPYMRGRMSDGPSYAQPVPVGGVMEAGTVSEVIASNNPAFAKGDIVLSRAGWQTHAISDGKGLAKIDPKLAPISTAIGVLGMPGMTAYTGLLDIGKPQPGETVVVAAASGAVGSAVGQIAKIKGARAVGIAGGPEKCALLTDKLGFDAAVDHRASDWHAQLVSATQDGIDVDFENVGGEIMDAIIARLNLRGRVALCGLISGYNSTDPPPGPRSFGNLLVNRVHLEGFIILDHLHRAPEAGAEIAGWIREGRLQPLETVVEGFEQLPTAINMLFDGANVGKLVVRIA